MGDMPKNVVGKSLVATGFPLPNRLKTSRDPFTPGGRKFRTYKPLQAQTKLAFLGQRARQLQPSRPPPAYYKHPPDASPRSSR